MATISMLSDPDGPLTHVQVPLGRREQPQRSFYGCQEFMVGLTAHVPAWICGRLQASQSPIEQMDGILYTWVSGRQLRYGNVFKDLVPGRDEVWELKTPDLRIFGWVYRPRVFIAAFVDYADWYKPPKATLSYDDARRKVVNVRNLLDLDEPKFTGGVFDALV